MSIYLFFFGPPLVCLAAPLLMPGTRSLLACILLLGGALASIDLIFAVETSRPGYDDSVGEGMAAGFLMLMTVGFVVGLTLKGVWVLAARWAARPGENRAGQADADPAVSTAGAQADPARRPRI